jgi:hypothetical protein
MTSHCRILHSATGRWSIATLLLVFLHASSSLAQMERRRADPGGPVDDIFWAPTIITTASVANLPARNVNLTIHHTFGLVSNGIDSFWGLDDAANIRIGLDYGVVDRISVGFGRSRFDKLWDFRFKTTLLRQTKDDRMPVEMAIKGDLGINTTDQEDYELVDRLNYYGGFMVARKFSDRLSVQLTPMWSHFNTVFIENDGEGGIIEEQNDHFAVGLVGRINVSDRLALMVEYLPVIGDRTTGTTNAFSVGIDLETGGHVFQLFLTSSQWTTEQHTIARNRDDFFKGDFRLGFNVNRVFAI